MGLGHEVPEHLGDARGLNLRGPGPRLRRDDDRKDPPDSQPSQRRNLRALPDMRSVAAAVEAGEELAGVLSGRSGYRRVAT
jgi:hypothetical protein